jgi:hypothetical protein
MILRITRKSFGIKNRLIKYSIDADKTKVGQFERMEKKNRIEENLNDHNTDISKIKLSSKELEPLKPMQHPRHYGEEESDNAIISHHVPPKNLTPYFHIPDEALTIMDLPCKEED